MKEVKCKEPKLLLFSNEEQFTPSVRPFACPLILSITIIAGGNQGENQGEYVCLCRHCFGELLLFFNFVRLLGLELIEKEDIVC